MKHVVFDARSLRDQRDGLGTYIREIFPRIAARANGLRMTILSNPAKTAFWKEAAPGASVVPSGCRPMWPGQNWCVPRVLRHLRPDLYFYPAHDPPMLTTSPFIFTIHDLTPLQMTPYYDRLNTVSTAYMRAVTAVGLRRASRILTVSHSTKTAVGELFGRGLLGKVRVIHLGASRFPSANSSVDGRVGCLLYVGTDRPHKNLDRLIQAYAEAHRRFAGLPHLEIVGGLRNEAHVRRLVDDVQLDTRVMLRGHVSDDELNRTCERTTAVLFPSLAEGFGLPILDAMSRGIPVVTSNRSACAEVAGEAALLVDPYRVDSIADGILAISTDSGLREELRRLGEARASSFSWERCAADTLQVIREVLGSSHGR
jgi:glycosyltransferase involved in cell wall biosynthesis